MRLEHWAVIHFVNVVRGENQYLIGRLGENALRILKYGVSGSDVPPFAYLLHGRNDLDILAKLGRKNAPSIANMTDEIQGFVLREHENSADIGIDAIGKREIDDAVCAAERHSGFS